MKGTTIVSSLLAAAILCTSGVYGVAARAAEAAEANTPMQLTDEQLKLIAAQYSSLTPEQRAKRTEAIHLQNLIRTGGEMPYPDTPRGTIRYVNLQRRMPAEMLEKVLRHFHSHLAYDVKIVDADCETSLKIKIVDEPDTPALLLAPDEGWAKINTTKLGDENTKPAFLAARTRKEMMRAFAYLTAGTAQGAPLYAHSGDAKAFDDIPEGNFPFEVVLRARKYLEGIGVVPVEYSNYRELLSLGFNIAPTNIYQQAIWDEFQSGKERGPSNPVRIPMPRRN